MIHNKLEEIEKKKTEKEKRIEEAKKRKEEKRKRAIRERRCFICRIFGHIACYCRNRGEDKRPVLVPKNKFKVLRDRVMEGGEGSGKKVVNVIRRECGQTLARVRVSWIYISIIIISL